MDYFPHDPKLPIHILSSCLKDTSTSYKYYWFLSILEAIEQGEQTIEKRSLFIRMIANSWYTINYFNVYYGAQDKLHKAVKQLIVTEDITIDEKKSVIVDRLLRTSNKATLRSISHFDGEVPYRFLSPWFPKIKGNKREIYELSQVFANDTIYAVDETVIRINPKWISYLYQNSGILKAFCLWKLCLYLQRLNPNVPDIANKLVKPPGRSSLLKQKKEFWDIVISETGPVTCIYTNKQLDIGKYAVEHFVPFAFVSHDLMWNLVPADTIFNSSKSDKLPLLDLYFNDFFDLQYKALKTIYRVRPETKLLQDYLGFLPDLSLLQTITPADLKHRFLDSIQPLVTIASNNGFEFMSVKQSWS